MPDPSVSFVASASSSSNTMAKANQGRDYGIYSRAMDAAEEAKAADIFPYLRVPEGGTILDVGAGTGALSERAARHFSHAHVIALDASHELLEIADHRRALISLVYGNALDQHLPDESLDAAMCSSCGHEIESFCGAGSMLKVLAARLRELKPGGAFVHRDFIKPSLSGDVLLEIMGYDIRAAQRSESARSDLSDYAQLNPAELFFRFHREFAGGGAFQYAIEEYEGRSFIRQPSEWAYEFYMRKDYVANWRNEIKEKYCYWDAREAELAFRASGFDNVQVIPHRNQWLIDNRFEGKIALYVRDAAGALQRIPFFDTHMTVVGTKPGQPQTNAYNGELPLVSYDNVLAQIQIDRDGGNVMIDGHRFELGSAPSLLGSKREVFFLSDGARVLKVPRSVSLNEHNCFKAMQQSIAHQDVLISHQVPHLKILDFDRVGPPYRYLVQEALPRDAECAADLIDEGRLTEADIKAVAEIVNRFERERRWQLDTNPFNWYRVKNQDGSTAMVYADGKVYRYDEKWAFPRVGLLQWVDPQFVRAAQVRCATIPPASIVDNPAAWWNLENEQCRFWAKYLDASLLPS